MIDAVEFLRIKEGLTLGFELGEIYGLIFYQSFLK